MAVVIDAEGAGRQDAGEVGLRGQGGWKRPWADQSLAVQQTESRQSVDGNTWTWHAPSADATTAMAGVCLQVFAPALRRGWAIFFLDFFLPFGFPFSLERPWPLCTCPAA